MRLACALCNRFALIVLSGLTFLAPAVSAQDVPTAAGQVPRFEPAPCPKLTGADELAKASCGYLVVLENHSRPTGRTIRLLVAKYPGRSPAKRVDPVVYLAGGPGDIAPLEVNGFIAADFIRDRDILVVSQRGTMFSEPALTCAPLDDFFRELLGMRFYSEATERAHLAATEACHRQLTATGADLSAYNSTESAADFADLRKVLGIAAWNVYGASYGSYLAQTLIRDHPEGIRSVVLDSVLPPTYTIPGNWWVTRTAFDNLFHACAADTVCNAAHPHLEATFTRLVNKLEAEPLTTTVSDPATGKDVKVILDGGALVDWLRNQNYAVPLLRAAPERIDGLAAGRSDSIEAIAKGSGRPGAATRSGCPCPRLRALLWRQLSGRLPIRDAGGPRRGQPGSVSGLSGLGARRGHRRLGIYQRRLPRRLEGPRRPGGNAPAGRQQHSDAPNLWQL